MAAGDRRGPDTGTVRNYYPADAPRAAYTFHLVTDTGTIKLSGDRDEHALRDGATVSVIWIETAPTVWTGVIGRVESVTATTIRPGP